MAHSPIVIIGAGIAGLSTAIRLAPHPVTVLTGAKLGEGAATAWAQGGIAAAIGPGDNPQAHAEDTIAAGAGLVDADRALQLATSAPAQIKWLTELGVPFDRDASGAIALGREAAHRCNRIAHASGDSTGAAVMQTLIRVAEKTPSIHFEMGVRATDLYVEQGRVTGIYVLDTHGIRTLLPASAVILATGGIGQLFAHTTNPGAACGEGLALAARAGAVLSDLEFVQFHPTALDIGQDPMPLLTEALRGDGAKLVNESGEHFMQGIPGAELAARDVVARAIWQQIQLGHRPALDATKALGEKFAAKYPFITETCRKAGLDPQTQALPVAPAAHYHMGGVAVDGQGRSSVPGLWVCGEAACTGLHGANRLASNSLLEALVYAEIIAADIAKADLGFSTLPAAMPEVVFSGDEKAARKNLRQRMFDQCGLIRDADHLNALLKYIAEQSAVPASPAMQAMLLISGMIVMMALSREESRGSHSRRDFPDMQSNPQHQRLTFDEFKKRIRERYGKNWQS